MNRERIASILKELRGKKEAKEVASAVGVTVSALSMYETGMRVPRDEIKLALAKYYDKSVEEIFFS